MVGGARSGTSVDSGTERFLRDLKPDVHIVESFDPGHR